MSSLPVPVSPWISTAESVGATMRTAFNAWRMPRLEPISWCSVSGACRRGVNIVVANVAMISTNLLIWFRYSSLCGNMAGESSRYRRFLCYHCRRRRGYLDGGIKKQHKPLRLGPTGALGNDNFATPEQDGVQRECARPQEGDGSSHDAGENRREPGIKEVGCRRWKNRKSDTQGA